MSASPAMSSAVSTPPVGLAGELRITSLVRSLRPALNSSRSKRNPFSWRRGTKTGPPADEIHHRLVDRERRVGQQHLVTLLDERQDGEEHYRLPARRDDYLFGADVYSPATRDINGYSLAQLWNTGGGSVVGMSVAQGIATGLHYVGRRIEVGFADLEMDDLTPLRLQSLRLRQDRKGRLRTQTLHPPRPFHTVLRSIESRQAPALHHTALQQQGAKGVGYGDAPAVAEACDPGPLPTRTSCYLHFAPLLPICNRSGVKGTWSASHVDGVFE